MTDEDFQIVNKVLEDLAPLIRAHGVDSFSIGKFAYYLIYIAGALADGVKMPPEKFRNMALTAYEDARNHDHILEAN